MGTSQLIDISKYVYEIKVTLKNIEPPIWRSLLVEKQTTLGDLHGIIQIAMGWDDEHLYAFQVGKNIYSSDPEVGKRGDSIDIHKLAWDKVRSFSYEYDFGDSWLHQVDIIKRVPLDHSISYPTCIAGERACPPEDSGGSFGFSEKLEALQDANHPDHEEITDWLGDFDPEEFDIEMVNADLAELNSFEESVQDLKETLAIAYEANCAGCDRAFDEGDQAFTLWFSNDGKGGEKLDFSEGEFLLFAVSGFDRPVIGFVTDGLENSVALNVCGEECAQPLRDAITQNGLSIFGLPESALAEAQPLAENSPS